MTPAPPEVSAAGRVLKEHSRSKLNLAKLVELRKRSRVERARQLASNIETQAHIQKSVEHYNLEAARLQLSNALGGMGQYVPIAARVIHGARLNPVAVARVQAYNDRNQRDHDDRVQLYQSRLDKMDKNLAQVAQERDATAITPARRRPIAGFRRLGRPADQMTLDPFGHRS